MLARLIFIAALAIASPGLAQTQSPATPTATPEQIAKASARADAIIAEADAAGSFRNTTDGGAPQVTHIASGMVCLFDMDGGDRVHIFPTGPGGMPRGDDVACLSTDERTGAEMTTYASRFRPLPSVAEVLRMTNTAIRQRWPDAVPYGGDVASATMEGIAAPETSVFLIGSGENRMVTMTLISHAGEWSYKVRITGPAERAREVTLLGAIAMTLIQMKLKAP